MLARMDPITRANTKLATQKQALAEKAQSDANDIARSVAGVDGQADDVMTAPPDPKTANVINPRTGRTPAAIWQDSLTYALQNKLPALGLSSKGIGANAKAAIQNTAGAIAQAAGVDLPTVQQEFKNNQSVLNNLMPKYMMLASSADTANLNLQKALDQSPNVPRTGSPLVNRYEQYLLGHQLTGDPALTKLETYIYAAAREYAKVTGGSYMSAAELSNAGAKKAEELLNAAQTPDQFKSAAAAMQDDMVNVGTPLGDALKKINEASPNVARLLATAHGQSVPSGAAAPHGGPAPNAVPSSGNTKKIGKYQVEIH